MIRVIEMQGIARVINLNNDEQGKPVTLRLLARQSKDIDDALVSEELKLAQKQKLVVLKKVGDK